MASDVTVVGKDKTECGTSSCTPDVVIFTVTDGLAQIVTVKLVRLGSRAYHSDHARQGNATKRYVDAPQPRKNPPLFTLNLCKGLDEAEVRQGVWNETLNVRVELNYQFTFILCYGLGASEVRQGVWNETRNVRVELVL